MKRTNLEEYIAIIQILYKNQRPLSLAEIHNVTVIETIQLEKHLDFLIDQKAIEKRALGVSKGFLTAPLGDKLLKYFTFT